MGAFRLRHAKAKHYIKKRPTSVSVRDTIKMYGGLNLVDSVENLRGGELLASKNYEPYYITGAYSRVGGYEAFDGQPRPHEATYYKVELVAITGGPFVVGETVTAILGATSETAVVASYTTGVADDGYIIITDLSNDIDTGATWTGGASGATGLAVSDSEPEGEEDEDLHDAAQLAAESLRRAVIEPVGGSLCEGAVNGVNIYNDSVYAFRNLVGGTEGSMWESTAAGWVRVELGFKLLYEDGVTQPKEGDLLTGATSGATCVVRREMPTGGMWAGDDAEGYVVTNEITGTFISGENVEIAGDVAFQLSSAVVPQTLPPDGTYRFRNHNFGGNIETFRMYGCNGEGEAFEYDGTTFVLITTGMPTDTPTHIGVHRGHLLLGYYGGSLQHSGKNKPLSFQPVFGANELLAGDTLTGLYEEVGDVSFVLTRNKTFRLEGFVQENIQLKLHNSETGAIPNTIQRIGRSIYLDDSGFTSIPTTEAFGDFASSQISTKIAPLIQEMLSTLTVTGSVIHRGKSLYRCFFSNKEAIVISFAGNKPSAITTIDYGLDVTCTANGEILDESVNDGKERVFVGAEDGYVYETDVGRNFNGEPIEAYLITAYHFSGSPETNKRYRRATLYMEGEGRASLQVSADYNYNENRANFEEIMDRAVTLGGGRYGISRHGAFVYSATSKSDIRLSMNSHARNVSLIIYHNETNELPHTINAIHYHISGRRIIRQ